jgi:hypothetical protein
MHSQKPFIVRGGNAIITGFETAEAALAYGRAILGAQVLERRKDVATGQFYYSDILSA